MRSLFCAVGAALIQSGHHVLAQTYPVLQQGNPMGYTLQPNSVTIFRMPVTAADVPAVPSCDGLTCDAAHNRLVCAGTCPAGCECSDGWAVEITAGAGTAEAGLAYSLSSTVVDRQVAYKAFVSDGGWEVVPFVTAHEHWISVGRKGTGQLQSDMVDMCMPTAMQARNGGGRSQPVMRNFTEMDCNCDDCAHSCGLSGSRKGSNTDSRDLCPQPWAFQQYDTPASFTCIRHSECPVVTNYQYCTYYASSEELSRSSYNADFCCNGHPKAFAQAITALGAPRHPHSFMEEYARPTVTFPVASVVNLTSCGDEGGQSTITDYVLPPIMYTECSRADMQVEDYYLYAINTASESRGVTLGFGIRTLAPAETHMCAEALGTAESGASHLVVSASALLLIVMCYVAF